MRQQQRRTRAVGRAKEAGGLLSITQMEYPVNRICHVFHIPFIGYRTSKISHQRNISLVRHFSSQTAFLSASASRPRTPCAARVARDARRAERVGYATHQKPSSAGVWRCAEAQQPQRHATAMQHGFGHDLYDAPGFTWQSKGNLRLYAKRSACLRSHALPLLLTRSVAQ